MDKSKVKELWDDQELVVVDNLIPEDILYQLRGYCLTTRPDQDVQYNGGYQQIYWQHTNGFPIPELEIVDVKLREVFSPILKNLSFNRAWYFIYENECPGVSVHADEASVNVNMWLTPDSSVVDENKNGLFIWDIKPPPDWSFHDFNKKTDKIENYLRGSGAKKRNVEYKCNRAMVFNSALFHETNGVSMKKGYWNRRINLTYLYT